MRKIFAVLLTLALGSAAIAATENPWDREATVMGCLRAADAAYYECRKSEDRPTCHDTRAVLIDRCDAPRKFRETTQAKMRTAIELDRYVDRMTTLSACQVRCEDSVRMCSTENNQAQACMNARKQCLQRCGDAEP